MEELDTSRDIWMALVASEFLAPLMDTLYNEAERPMECYNMIGHLMNSNYFS